MTDLETFTASILLAALIGLIIGYPMGVCHGLRVGPATQMKRRVDKFRNSEG